MPLTWLISHDSQHVTVTAFGNVRIDDFDKYLTAMTSEGARRYRKLVDLTYANLELTVADIRALNQRIIDLTKEGPIGPVALVVDTELKQEMAEMFQHRDKADRPLRIFLKPASASDWLEEHAVGR